MKSNAIIVAPGDDAHALAVADRIGKLYGSRIDCNIFDFATFPIASSMEWSYGASGRQTHLTVAPALATSLNQDAARILVRRDSRGTRRITSTSTTGVWWRRAREIVIHPDVVIPEVRTYCLRTAASCLRAFFSDCVIHNDPSAEDQASCKPDQLKRALEAGLNVPRTLVTCDAGRALEFVNRLHGEGHQVIYKHAATAAAIPMTTRLFTEADVERLHTLRYAPAMFQQRISGGVDLRVAILGSQLFAAEWRSPMAENVDIRVAPGARMFSTILAPRLSDTLLTLHASFRLTFGVYDLKLNEQGTPYFLEVNPSGQWLDLELEAGHPIAEAWARMLVERRAATTELPPLTEADVQAFVVSQQSEAAMSWTEI